MQSSICLFRFLYRKIVANGNNVVTVNRIPNQECERTWVINPLLVMSVTYMPHAVKSACILLMSLLAKGTNSRRPVKIVANNRYRVCTR